MQVNLKTDLLYHYADFVSSLTSKQHPFFGSKVKFSCSDMMRLNTEVRRAAAGRVVVFVSQAAESSSDEGTVEKKQPEAQLSLR